MNTTGCTATEVVLTREAGANAVGDTFRSLMGSVPVVGGLVSGLVPDTMTANVLRTCPGKVLDHRTPLNMEYVLLALAVALLVIYTMTKK
jgi:hypothetical protein